MLKYRYDPEALEIRETPSEGDTEFEIRILREEPHLQALRKVQRRFEDNEDYTDVLFYAYPGHVYKVIVQKEHYADFLAEMFKHRLLASLEWTT